MRQYLGGRLRDDLNKLSCRKLPKIEQGCFGGRCLGFDAPPDASTDVFRCWGNQLWKTSALPARVWAPPHDRILDSSCLDANRSLFEALLGGDVAIIFDALNHASIIDGVRLSTSPFRWTASSPVLAAFAIWRRNTTQCSWSTTALRSASSAGMAAARPSIAASKAKWTSLPVS